jgi:F0F1-type ATP synthase membrane subunit a
VECCLGTDSAPLICVYVLFVFVSVSVFPDALRDTTLKVPRRLSSCLQWAYAMIASVVDVSVDTPLKWA